MDSDNPWGAPSPSPASTPLDSTTSPPRSPRISYSPSEDERPAWGSESPSLTAGDRPDTLPNVKAGGTDVTSGEGVEVVREETREKTASPRREEDEAEQAHEAQPATPAEDKPPTPKDEEAPSAATAGLSKAQLKRLKKKKSKAKVKATEEAEQEDEGERGEVPPLPAPAVTAAVEEPVTASFAEPAPMETDGAEPLLETESAPEPPSTDSTTASSSLPAFPSSAPPMDAFPSDDDFSTSSPPATPSALPSSFPAASEAPPMDVFPDDDFDSPTPEPAAAQGAAADDGFDDFDDFGDSTTPAAAGDEDDFGDFGDFGSAAPLDASAFEAPSLPPPVPVVPVAPSATPPSAFPPLRLDLTNATRRAVAPQLAEFCRAAWARAGESVSDEPERQVGGVGQVLVEESTRNLLADLSALPTLRPLDWRRSKIRREHLVSMGMPVNLDDTEPKPHPLTLSTNSRRFGGPVSSSPTRSASAPPLSAGPFSPSSHPPSRSATPFADRERQRAGQGPPPLDTKRAEELMGTAEEDLTLMSLARLKELGEELDRISVEASGVLTHALMMREKEAQDKEVYNGMISDLVSSAAKMKTSSALGRPQPKRASSGRWGR
ncbi:hypothetical protein JCM10213_000887 [Rhodosporidiobolus nylandii]